MPLGKTIIRRILRTMGLSPQRPQRRALRYRPQAVTQWKSQSFTRIARGARVTGAVTVFVDDAGLDSRSVDGRTWEKQGESPVVRVANSKFRVSMLAAVSPEGKLVAMLPEGWVNAAVFRAFR